MKNKYKNSLTERIKTFVGFIIFTGVVTAISYPYGNPTVNDICKRVGYEHPEQVISFHGRDKNGDGVHDFMLVLKNGTTLEYISGVNYIKAKVKMK